MKNLIRSTREAAGMQQNELGRLAGIHHSNLSSIEHGERCSYHTAKKIADVLKTTPEMLFPGVVLRRSARR